MDRMREFLDDATAVRSVDNMRATLARCAESLGFPYFAYMTARLPGEHWPTVDLPFFLTNLPSEWVSRYRRRNYLRFDPVHRACMSQLTPLVWDVRADRFGPSDRLGREQRRVLGEMRDLGIRCGVTAPVHGPGSELGLLSVALDHDDQTRKCGGDDLHRSLLQIAAKTHTVVTRRLIPPNRSGYRGMSERERLCLQWTAKGKTSWEISRILDRSESVVNFHLKNAVAKLNASNKCHATVLAVEHGLIDL